MDLDKMKELYAEKMNIKHFDAWVTELMYWNKDEEIRKWYCGFATFCYEYKSK